LLPHPLHVLDTGPVYPFEEFLYVLVPFFHYLLVDVAHRDHCRRRRHCPRALMPVAAPAASGLGLGQGVAGLGSQAESRSPIR
jgi:hypothetical protein